MRGIISSNYPACNSNASQNFNLSLFGFLPGSYGIIAQLTCDSSNIILHTHVSIAASRMFSRRRFRSLWEFSSAELHTGFQYGGSFAPQSKINNEILQISSDYSKFQVLAISLGPRQSRGLELTFTRTSNLVQSSL